MQREVVQGCAMKHMSVHAQDLQTDGYDVGEIPEDESALMQSVLNDPEAKYNSADLNVAYKMKVDEYQKLCPYAEALEENWGKPPGAAPACARQCQAPWPAILKAAKTHPVSLAARSPLVGCRVSTLCVVAATIISLLDIESCMAMKTSGGTLCKSSFCKGGSTQEAR